DSRGDRPSPGFPMFEATKSVILIPFRAKSELRGNANAIDSRGFSPHWPAQRTLKKSARSPSLTGCVFNHLRFRKKKVPREKALRRRVPRAHRPPGVAKARLDFLSSGSFEASPERISNSHWPGSLVHHLSCPFHRSLGTTITGAFWVEPWADQS